NICGHYCVPGGVTQLQRLLDHDGELLARRYSVLGYRLGSSATRNAHAVDRWQLRCFSGERKERLGGWQLRCFG
ncbi:hypothetical protein PanWU01x14_056900, partial [Parasponia andersonii]